MDELYDLDQAFNALRLIDGWDYIKDDTIRVYGKEFKKILKDPKEKVLSTEEHQLYILECFDALLYSFERIQNSIEIGVVINGDVTPHFKHYINVLNSDEDLKNTIINYSTTIGYEKAVKFINEC